MSLGRASVHSFASKLSALQSHAHFTTIELFFEDLEIYASTHFPFQDPKTALLNAAHSISDLCSGDGITIMCLQPFMHYEGLRDRTEHAAAVEKMKTWIQTAGILGTDLIAIPSSFLPEDEASGDLELIVSDLREIASLGAAASPPVRFAYEALAWGTYVNRWEQAWDIVQRIGMTNFGLCLDTFNIAARIYADPAAPSGVRPGGESAVKESMVRLVQTVEREKVFYIQVVDAKRLSTPLVEGHEFFHPQQPARMSWSRNCRLFYGERERGAYLPVKEIARAIFELRWQGVVSMELFNRVMSDADPDTPRKLAERARKSWDTLKRDFVLREEGESIGEVC